MIVFPLLNPQMIKVAFASWFLNFNSIKENEADQSFEGSISSFFFSPRLCQLYYHSTNKYVKQIELHAPNTHHNYGRPNTKISHLVV